MIELKSSHIFNLQLFAEEGEGEPTTDEQQVNDYFDNVESDFLNGKTYPADKIVKEPVEPKQEHQTETEEHEEPAEIIPEPETKQEDEQTLENFRGKIKYKENGAVVELSMDELIERAQKGANYERKVQELATQRKAFELAMQKPPEPVKSPANELQEYEQQLNNYAGEFQRKYGVEFEQYNPVHLAKFTESRFEQRELQKSQDYQRSQSQYAEQQLQTFYQKVSTEKDYSTINKVAQDALFSLPSKGAEGLQEFQKMYAIYQKINERDTYVQQRNMGMNPTFTPQPLSAAEVTALSDFYNGAKNDYYAKQNVPKAQPKKSPVRTERPGNGDVDNTPRFDFKSVSNMDADSLDDLYNNMFTKKLKEK